MPLFFQSKLIPKEYREWFESQFKSALRGRPDLAAGGSPVAAVEKLVEDFSEANEDIKNKEESKEEPKITKE